MLLKQAHDKRIGANHHGEVPERSGGTVMAKSVGCGGQGMGFEGATDGTWIYASVGCRRVAPALVSFRLSRQVFGLYRRHKHTLVVC
jgi:hypothetical protein